MTITAPAPTDALSLLGRPTQPSKIAALLDIDGYKLSHAALYPQPGSGHGDSSGTTRILINYTNRSNKYMPGSSHAVAFGVQAFCQRFLIEKWEPFFAATEDEVVAEYEQTLLDYLGPNNITTDRIRALHRLGYLPLHVSAVPEGTLVPFGCAVLTVENTVDEFYWLPNYIETALSAEVWHPSTVATIALEYRELMEAWAEKTGGDLAAVDFQAHDFSMRGQTSLESAASSGAGHLLSFLGTDTMPSLDFIRRYYPGDNGWVGASVPATEHSVMCIRGEQGELDTFKHILATYPTGIVSAVSDGYDLWKVMTEILPEIKDLVMARDGRLVIRPDSGDPVDIMCGTVRDRALAKTPEEKGVVQLLAELAGTTKTSKGFDQLDTHWGVIYGDSITIARAADTFERLAAKGFASTNVVLGIGSFTYQMVSRDSMSGAVKSTYAVVDGFPVDIQKDPKTGEGKKSAKGRLALLRDETGEIYQVEQATPEQEAQSLIQTLWIDGRFVRAQSLADVRGTLKAERAARAERNAAKELVAA